MEDITRNDLEQLFENQTEFISLGFQNVDKRFDQQDDDIAELRATMDRIDRRDKEDIQTLYEEVKLIKNHLGLKSAA